MSGRPRLTRRGWTVLAMLLVVSATVSATVTTRLADQPPAAAGTVDIARIPQRAVLEPRPLDRWAPAVSNALPDDPWATLQPDGGLPTPEQLVTSAPVVVTASGGQPVHLARARQLAAQLRAPLVLSSARPGSVGADQPPPARLRSLVEAWDTQVLVAVGDVVVPSHGLTVRRWTVGATPPDAIDELVAEAAAGTPDAPAAVGLLRGDAGPEETAAAAAVGLELVALPDPWHPDGPARAALAGSDAVHLLGSAEDWGDVDADVLDWLVAVTRAGHELPGGGLRLFPDRRLVALYGHPEGAALGLLGEQGVEDAIVRAREHVAPYAELSDVPVVPAFEIIATIASASSGSRGDYSRRTPVATLEPWVDAAEEAGLYVVLDLQPGRTDFLSQAEEYEELLRRPHVGLALDPEWRLRPDQVHLRQIGSVGIDEVNEVGEWLAGLTREHALPQKLFVLHQFRLDMIRERERLVTDHPELATLIHVDGQGGQPAKDATYRTLTRTAPPGVWWGWKNFYDEDVPGLRSPEGTMAVTPTPDLITFQ